jgi:hypothetical protein
MIGVLVQESERDVACEFFELFKTPWEFLRRGVSYDVVISTGQTCDETAARLVLLFSSEMTAFDRAKGVDLRPAPKAAALFWAGGQIPLYGNAAVFPSSRFASLEEKTARLPVAFVAGSPGKTLVRLGYNLFEEVRSLLTAGQPAVNASVPTLDLHIALLRDLITGSGLPLVEIPPVPDAYAFIACLTHDVDHPLLRNHRCDHTMFGFLRRATIGSLLDFFKGRKSFRNLAANWSAASILPFVHLGFARDFWRDFDRYLDIETGLGSTFFVIPKKDQPGCPLDGQPAPMRACRYSLEEIKPQLDHILAAGGEVAVHGIDAWVDTAAATEERGRLAQAVPGSDAGVRMHWLFFNENSTAVLDRAGFSYDSTFGYNETVGFRAGTAQAFKPPGANHLLELPLLIMDTALFYPNHRNLSEPDAARAVGSVIDDVRRHGGSLTINWHDRSIAPERLWDVFYTGTLLELRGRGAWFPTASQAVSWFRKRRSACLEAGVNRDGSLTIKASVKTARELPGLRVRVHKPRSSDLFDTKYPDASPAFVDLRLKDTLETTIAI